jgi:transketolase
LDTFKYKTQSENTIKRFKSARFEVQNVERINSIQFINSFLKLKASREIKPKILIFKSVLGFGIDEIQGNNLAHGEFGLKYIHFYKKIEFVDNTFIKDLAKTFIDERRKYTLYVYRN